MALYGSDNNQGLQQVIGDFISAKVIRAAHGVNRLQEVMVDFWLNHFNVYIADDFARPATPSYAIRGTALRSAPRSGRRHTARDDAPRRSP